VPNSTERPKRQPAAPLDNAFDNRATSYPSGSSRMPHSNGPRYEDGIWDDGEWLSWDWINEKVYEQELKQRFPGVAPELIQVFQELVDTAIRYKDVTGRYLPVFGELGELFAEIQFGLKRHKPGAAGSDGRLGNDFVEIKTITPIKSSDSVTVKRQGNFNKLLVIKISDAFDFEARMLDRKKMSKGNGRLMKASWSSMKKLPVKTTDAD
jgi:hypothetical protein